MLHLTRREERSNSPCDVIEAVESLYQRMHMQITLLWSKPAPPCKVGTSPPSALQLDISVHTHRETHVAVGLRIVALIKDHLALTQIPLA